MFYSFKRYFANKKSIYFYLKFEYLAIYLYKALKKRDIIEKIMLTFPACSSPHMINSYYETEEAKFS